MNDDFQKIQKMPAIPQEVWDELARVQRLQDALSGVCGVTVDVSFSIALDELRGKHGRRLPEREEENDQSK